MPDDRRTGDERRGHEDHGHDELHPHEAPIGVETHLGDRRPRHLDLAVPVGRPRLSVGTIPVVGAIVAIVVAVVVAFGRYGRTDGHSPSRSIAVRCPDNCNQDLSTDDPPGSIDARTTYWGVTMRDAVIVGAARTPVGRRGGGLSGVHPVDLSGQLLAAFADRLGFDPADVDDVVWGCVSQVGEQSWNVGRNAALAAGWPESVPGTTLDRQCGSSQQAVHFAAAAVISGQCDFVIAGGVESMSRVAMGASVVSGPGSAVRRRRFASATPASRGSPTRTRPTPRRRRSTRASAPR